MGKTIGGLEPLTYEQMEAMYMYLPLDPLNKLLIETAMHYAEGGKQPVLPEPGIENPTDVNKKWMNDRGLA